MNLSPIDRLFLAIPKCDTTTLRKIQSSLDDPRALEAVKSSIENLIRLRELEENATSPTKHDNKDVFEKSLVEGDYGDAFSSLVEFFEDKQIFQTNSQLVEIVNKRLNKLNVPKSYRKASRSKIANSIAKQLMTLSVQERKEIIDRFRGLAEENSGSKGYEDFFKFMLNDE